MEKTSPPPQNEPTNQSTPPPGGVSSLHVIGLQDPYLAQSRSLVQGPHRKNHPCRVRGRVLFGVSGLTSLGLGLGLVGGLGIPPKISWDGDLVVCILVKRMVVLKGVATVNMCVVIMHVSNYNTS